MVLNNLNTNTIDIYTYIHNQKQNFWETYEIFDIKYDSAKNT